MKKTISTREQESNYRTRSGKDYQPFPLRIMKQHARGYHLAAQLNARRRMQPTNRAGEASSCLRLALPYG